MDPKGPFPLINKRALKGGRLPLVRAGSKLETPTLGLKPGSSVFLPQSLGAQLLSQIVNLATGLPGTGGVSISLGPAVSGGGRLLEEQCEELMSAIT